LSIAIIGSGQGEILCLFFLSTQDTLGDTMKNIVKITGFALCLGLSLPAFSEDGATLYVSKGCAGCHGADGNTPLMPAYPKVGAQNPGYTIAQLKDFKSGKRSNGNAALMTGMVASLTDDDMKKLADFLATEPSAEAAPVVETAAETTVEPAVEEKAVVVESTPLEETKPVVETANTAAADLYIEKACIACHGAKGFNPAMNSYPEIGGQNDAYLLNQMKDIKSGVRKNSHSVAMANIMNTVSDADMAVLATWLSEQSD